MKRSAFVKVRILTIIFMLVFSLFPVNGLPKVNAHGGENHSKEFKNLSEEEALLENVEKIEELQDKRTENSKTFRNSNLSFTSDIYTGPTHYKGNDGKFKPIKNKFIGNDEPDKNDFKYKNIENKFSVKLSDKANKNELISLSFGKEKLSFSLNKANDVEISSKKGNVYYKDISRDTDLKYTIMPTGIKEDIILHSKEAQTSFLFTIGGSLTARQIDRKIVFMNKNGEVVWEMYPPFMEDNKGVYSQDIHYTLTTQNGKQAIRMDVSDQFVKDPSREFPIIVDPSVTLGGLPLIQAIPMSCRIIHPIITTLLRN